MADIQLTNAKINRKRPHIAEIACPVRKWGIKESNDDVRTLTGSS